MHTLECTEASGQVAVEPEACTCSASNDWNSTDAPMLGVRAALVESLSTNLQAPVPFTGRFTGSNSADGTRNTPVTHYRLRNAY